MSQTQATTAAKGFLAWLFDFSFSSLITTKIIKVVYVILTIFIGLGALAWFITFLSRGGFYIVVAIVIAPIGWLLYMIWARISLELVIILFRIGDDVRALAQRSGAPLGTTSGYGPPAGYAPQPGAPGTNPSQPGYTPSQEGYTPPPSTPGYTPPPAGPQA